MLTIRRAEERGAFDHGWLDTRHTFSFAGYQDPRHMGFRNLRVVNEDRVRPGQGFGTHSHRDMEILTYVLEGGLQHRDSTGTGTVIRPEEVQRMSAGTGIAHSEFNASQEEPVHFLQIWILPARPGIAPGYEQKTFPLAGQPGRLHLVASPDGREDSLTLHADARVYAGRLGDGERARLALAPGRAAWVQMARGRARVNGQELKAGDGAGLVEEPEVTVEGIQGAEVLVFDLA
jgi:redox-sensitive bicupin YhaK (pirin superfamily)